MDRNSVGMFPGHVVEKKNPLFYYSITLKFSKNKNKKDLNTGIGINNIWLVFNEPTNPIKVQCS